VCVSTRIGVVVSGGADGKVLLHELPKGAYVRALYLPATAGPVSHVSLSDQANLIVASRDDGTVRSFNINGVEISAWRADVTVSCVAPLPHSRVVAVGLSRGAGVRILRLPDLAPVQSFAATAGPVCSLALVQKAASAASALVAGVDGGVVVYAIPPRWTSW